MTTTQPLPRHLRLGPCEPIDHARAGVCESCDPHNPENPNGRRWLDEQDEREAARAARAPWGGEPVVDPWTPTVEAVAASAAVEPAIFIDTVDATMTLEASMDGGLVWLTITDDELPEGQGHARDVRLTPAQVTRLQEWLTRHTF